VYQIQALRFGVGHWLFHKHVLSGPQARHPDLIVKVVRQDDQNGIDVVKDVAIVGYSHASAGQLGGLLSTFRDNVNHHHQIKPAPQ